LCHLSGGEPVVIKFGDDFFHGLGWGSAKVGKKGSEPTALVHGIEQEAVGFQTVGVLGSRGEADFA
jgi:hypothetical protein